MANFLTILVITLVVLGIASVAAFLITRKAASNAPSAVFTILAVLPNAGFVGLPIIKAVYGDLGVFYLSAFLVGFNIVVWTICVFFFTGISVRSLKEALNPGFIAAILGTALFLLRIALPTPLAATVTQLGSLTTPLSMLLLGARLSQISPKVFRSKLLWCAYALKLLVMPMVTFGIMHLLKVEPLLIGVTVISMAMPSPAVAQLFAEKYGDDVELATTGVSISTLLCIVTIPLIMLII